jgi:hypothetical protein
MGLIRDQCAQKSRGGFRFRRNTEFTVRLRGLFAARYNHRFRHIRSMGMSTILLILLILFLVGALPTWGHSRNWGYGPSGGLGLVLVVVVVLLLMGRI